MSRTPAKLDELDLAILTAMHEYQKAGILEGPAAPGSPGPRCNPGSGAWRNPA